jgi:hypothetical protein
LPRRRQRRAQCQTTPCPGQKSSTPASPCEKDSPMTFFLGPLVYHTSLPRWSAFMGGTTSWQHSLRDVQVCGCQCALPLVRRLRLLSRRHFEHSSAAAELDSSLTNILEVALSCRVALRLMVLSRLRRSNNLTGLSDRMVRSTILSLCQRPTKPQRPQARPSASGRSQYCVTGKGPLAVNGRRGEYWRY